MVVFYPPICFLPFHLFSLLATSYKLLRSRLQLPWFSSTMSSNGNILLPSTRYLRLHAKSTLLLLSALILLVPTCYYLESQRMDRENAREILSLDLEVADHFMKGKKVINRWGAIKREDVMVTCSGGAAGSESVDWSNLQTCLDNAVLHTNCVPVCDSSFSDCPGCLALKTDHDTQLSIAQDRCHQRAKYQCPLTTKPNGKYNYPALSQCCQGAIPFSSEACMCENQLSASSTCYSFGTCLAGCATDSLRTTCSGKIATLPSAPLTCTNPLAASCNGAGTGVDLSCTTGNLLYNGVCLQTCPDGTYGLAGVCTKCSDGTYLYNGACITTCPTYFFGASGINVCKSCSSHAMTCTSASAVLTCDPGYYSDRGLTCQANPCTGTFKYLSAFQGFTICYKICPTAATSTSQNGLGGPLFGYYANTDPNYALCLPCSAGTYGASNVCTTCPQANAVTCTSATAISQCSPGYTLNVPGNSCFIGSCPAQYNAVTSYLSIMTTTGLACVMPVYGQGGNTAGVGTKVVKCGKFTLIQGGVSQTYQSYADTRRNLCMLNQYCTKANSGTVDSDGYGVCNNS